MLFLFIYITSINIFADTKLTFFSQRVIQPLGATRFAIVYKAIHTSGCLYVKSRFRFPFFNYFT